MKNWPTAVNPGEPRRRKHPPQKLRDQLRNTKGTGWTLDFHYLRNTESADRRGHCESNRTTPQGGFRTFRTTRAPRT